MGTPSESRARRSSRRALLVAATVLALVALAVSLGGLAEAKAPEGKGEVEVLAIARGSFTTPADGGPIELSNASFTQEAGATILAIARLDGDLPPLEGDEAVPCSFAVLLEIPGVLAVELEKTNGGFHNPRATEGIVPTETDVPRTVQASVAPDCDTSEVTLDVTVAVVALR